VTMAKNNASAIKSERGSGRPMDNGGDNVVVCLIPTFLSICLPFGSNLLRIFVSLQRSL
jgi:hypothetical protein